MINLKRLLQKPKLLSRTLGINFNNLLIVVDRMYEIWNKTEYERLTSKQRKRAIGGGRKYKLESIEEKILLILVFYRHNMTHELLGIIFGLDASNITRLINKISPIFESAIDPEMKAYLENVKKESEKYSNINDFFKKYPALKTIIGDATEQRRNRPSDNEKRKEFYSGKKKMFANKTQILIDEERRILDVSKSYAGSFHDKKIFDLENTMQKIPRQSIFMGDLGYLGIKKENFDRKIDLPYKKNKGQEKLPIEQREFNRVLAKKRVIVEHAIGRIKKFRICSDVYRGKEDNYNQIFRNVAALVNLNYC